MTTIEFKASLEDVAGAAPRPVPVNKFIPEWYKKMSKNTLSKEENPRQLPKIINENGLPRNCQTVKECPPIRDYLCSGYIIPLWADLLISKNQETGIERYSWADGDKKMIEIHPFDQFKGSMFEEHASIHGGMFKLNCPWFIKTPPGYSCFFFSPYYHNSSIEILPAIVDTDGHHEVNFPFILRETGENIIEMGEPIIQVFPFKRESWSHEIKTLEKSDFIRIRSFFKTAFAKAYKRNFHKKKVFR
tara:strand:- start:88 stop:825 length:738 start_codon:yes stop_codon:yes gene_type:complete